MRATKPAMLSIAFGVGLGGSLTIPTAWAFDSFPPGSEHDTLTRAALEATGWETSRQEPVIAAVRNADWAEVSWQPRLWPPSGLVRLSGNARYRPEHHFDRPPGASSASAFAAGVAYVASERDALARAMSRGDTRSALGALGRALHAVQDVMSHSNYCDLPPVDQASVRATLIDDPSIAAPPSLVLTGYDIDAPAPEEPAADPYPHRHFAKDSREKNPECSRLLEGRSVYECAYASAVDASIAFVLSVLEHLEPDERCLLRGTCGSTDFAY